MGIEIEVPAIIIVDALAGKTCLAKEFALKEEDKTMRALSEGWMIKSCNMKEGNIEIGEAPKVVIELIPPPLAIFGK